MRSGYRLLALILALAVLVAPAAPASALDFGQWVPGLRFTPFVSERLEYQSNVFQAPNGAQDDLIFKTIPGFLGEYVVGQHSLSVGYRAEILRFLTLTNQDKVHHFFVGQLRLEFNRLRVNLREDFAQTSDPPGTELTGRIENTTNTLTPEVEYRFAERFAAGVNSSYIHVSFPTVPQLDRDEYLVGASVFWRVFPKTDLRLNVNHGEKFFDSAFAFRDVTRDQVLLGLRGELTAKLSSTFRIGYEDREPQSSRLKSYRGLVAGGDWQYKPTERLTLSLITDRSVQESTFGGQLFFVGTSATILATQQFGPKLTAGLRATLGDNSYPSKETLNGRAKFRDDTIFGWGGDVSYNIQRWFRIGAEYAHTTRSSNFHGFNFQDDRISIFGTLQF